MSQEVMKLALEALESCGAAHITDGGRQWYDEKLVDTAYAALQEALAEQPAPPPECQTEAEKTAYAFGWFKALESVREKPAQRKPLTYVDLRRIANQCGLGANEVSARTQATVDNYARAIEAAHGIKGNT